MWVFFSSWRKFSFLKGKEIIEYYLKQLEEEGITFVPRWTPPVACKSESSTSHPRRPVSPAINIPESATKEGLSNKEILNTSSSPSEPTAGTPDGMGGLVCFFTGKFCAGEALSTGQLLLGSWGAPRWLLSWWHAVLNCGLTRQWHMAELRQLVQAELVSGDQVWAEKLLAVRWVANEQSVLTLKFRDGYKCRNDGEETGETSLLTVFWEFRKILALGDQSFSKDSRSSKPSGAVDWWIWVYWQNAFTNVPSLAAEGEIYLLHADNCVCCLAHLFIDSVELYSVLTAPNTAAALRQQQIRSLGAWPRSGLLWSPAISF